MYVEGLEGLGYEMVLEGGWATDVLPYFATDHEAGERIMDHCFDRVRVRVDEELGPQTLSGPVGIHLSQMEACADSSGGRCGLSAVLR